MKLHLPILLKEAILLSQSVGVYEKDDITEQAYDLLKNYRRFILRGVRGAEFYEHSGYTA
jgi:hypothetical protein